jgi:hypothetical protein
VRVPDAKRPLPAGEASLKDTLAKRARAAPSGGRAKWMVWAVVGGVVLVIGLLQALGIVRSPVAERVKEEHLRREREAQEQSAPAPKASPPAPSDAPDQGTTK